MSILGIRPDWIKMKSVISRFDRGDFEHVLVHTGQHYSYNIDGIFFEQLEIREPDHHLGVGSGTDGEQTARIIERSEKVILKEKPDMVVVFGDSNSSQSAIAAAKANFKVARIEAGMRAYDWRMPEEKNKRMIDHICRFLFVYTKWQEQNLLKENVKPYRIFPVGNPTVDVINMFREKAYANSISSNLGLRRGDYFLVTAHRSENVDDRTSLQKILKALELAVNKYEKPIVWPLYPRTRDRIKRFNLSIPKGVKVLEPLGFLEFLHLEMNALTLISDSGTVQEEGCILGVPCVVIRISTERPETVVLGSSIIAGLEPANVIRSIETFISERRKWDHPYGDGHTADRVADVLKNYEQKPIMEEMLKFEASDEWARTCFSPYVLQ
jgi:UDP-N-acetylglucosamine 2-epimerase (non-hydrolysing)